MIRSGFYKSLLFATLFFVSIFVMAQNSVDKIGMADTLRSSGKIYVVVGVLVIIFLGFTAFLVMTDKKISRLEKEMKNKK